MNESSASSATSLEEVAPLKTLRTFHIIEYYRKKGRCMSLIIKCIMIIYGKRLKP